MPHWKRKDSPYRYGYVYDRDDKRTAIRSLRVSDARAADAKLREWEREAADPAYAAAKGCLASEAIDGFVKDCRARAAVGKLAAATVDYYEDKTGTLNRLLGSECRLADVDATFVDRYIAARRTEKAKEHTIQKELAAWKVVLRFAKRAGRWSGDEGAIFPKFSAAYEPRDRALSVDELDALLEALPSRDVAAQLAFAVATSAEASAIRAAQKGDVMEGGRYVLLRGTKRELRWRTVPIVTELQQRLLAFTLKHAEGTDPLMFRCTEWGLRNGLRSTCTELGIAHVSPNDLRRTFAVQMREAGFALELIAPLMGHKDTRMLERVYGRLSPEQLRERLISALNASAACAQRGDHRAAQTGTNGHGGVRRESVA
jgi:integrase